MRNTLRLAALALQILLVGAVMLTAGAMAIVMNLASYPFCWVRNTASMYYNELLREWWGPGW